MRCSVPKLQRLLVLVLVALWGCATPPQETASVEIIKSPNDGRDYRYLELPNRLKVVLIADPDSDKAAAALSVFRGSNHDPQQHQGLAHFLEHMLFIGTEKYPEVDGYQQFLTAHGGTSNAYTAPDHTNYFFDVAPEQFPEALDRFAWFFIAPLLSPEYVEREKNAVHSEYQMQTKDDGWRGMTAAKLLMNPEHPLSRFSIGSLDTLTGEVQSALLAFWREQYSADQMSLVVLGPESLDSLEQLVRERFTSIEDRNLGPDEPSKAIFADGALPVRLDVKPVQERREVSYTFPVPTVRPHFEAKPEFYIANLLGHEGRGSLFATLKSFGWATSLAATTGELDEDESQFDVTISLTEEGARHIDEITAWLFAQIDLIRAEGPQAWRQKELELLGELGFRFMEKADGLRTVYVLAPVLMHYPPRELLRNRYIYTRFDAALITQYLALLRPDNVAIQVTLPEAVTTAQEPWFGVAYHRSSGAPSLPELTAEQRATLKLPEANPFLPEDLTLIGGEQAPRSLATTPEAEYWLHTDTTFGVPKSNVRFTLRLDGGITTPADRAAASLYADVVADATNQWAYATLLAGMNANVGVRPAGFRFDITGYNDKQLVLAERVLDTFRTLRIDPERFAVLKADFARTLENAVQEKPFMQSMAAVGQAIHASEWPEQAIAAALRDITPESLTAWRDRRLARVSFLGLAHGNVNEADARAVLEAVKKRFTLAAVETDLEAPVQLKQSAAIELPIEHSDASLVAFIQQPDDSVHSRAISQLAAHLVQQGFFTSLRTEQQLGYAVGMAARSIDRQPGLLFMVQSPSAAPGKILDAIRTYLQGTPATIESMPEETFALQREGLLVKLLEADKNLAERTERYWVDIDEGITTFDGNRQLADAVRKLTRADVVNWLRTLPGRLDAQSLVVSSRGRFEPLPAHGQKIGSVSEFKKRFQSGTAAGSAAAPSHNAG
jgi:secreted Zn-dependent insulinase-like peptidase